MIRFNALLTQAGVDPKEVKLVRHQDNRSPDGPTPYHLWRAGDGRLELYQQIQSSTVFSGASFIAVFVVSDSGETVFVGIYSVNGVGKAEPGLIDPISGGDSAGKHFYDLSPHEALSAYRGRLIVDWGKGYRKWVQLARNQDKEILEVRRDQSERPFPGFLDFLERFSGFAGIPPSWRTALSAASGVYLLMNPDSGQQYVGSAQGATGFWGRWEQYIASGHGGNKRMLDLPSANYQVCILEVASSSAREREILNMEDRWKRKLMSRKFGLNGN